nr:bromodomain and phd finger-containing protein 3 [Quercus suber]
MGQIVKRKKKGRPSKADLARRAVESAEAAEREVRRSLRRRNVRYNIDYDDYLDEDDDEEDQRRREKKLKLVVKLNQGTENTTPPPPPPRPRSAARGPHATDDEEDEEEERVVRNKVADSKGVDSAPGTPSDPPLLIPLPDKKTLVFILDKLQKKDTYGVYAEPVDPEELPDYHEVIEHPMDFATVRKKLASGLYSTLEQFESDIFLICSNAMQYNAPDTIYYKQARSIQELAKNKFERLRMDFERAEKELKSELKTRSNSLIKKPVKKPFCRTSQEPVGSDFSTGATLATIGDVQNVSNPNQGGNCERPSNTDVVEGTSSLVDTNPEKVEELSSGKGLSKWARKQFVFDDNRRVTYNISNQPVVRSESIFSTFEAEIKQLVAVGLHAEYSYARSLARFAATLGPVAWKVASQRIEQALPAGCKFGRGWVGEYEPLPTPVLMLENRMQKEPGLVSKLQSNAELRKDDKTKTPVPAKERPVSGPTLEGKHSLLAPVSGHTTEGKLSVSGSAGTKPSTPDNAIYQLQNPQSRNFAKPESKVIKQFELNSLPSVHQNNAELIAEKQFSSNSETSGSRSKEPAPRNINISQPVPFKQPDTNGVVTGGLPNGKVNSSSLNNKMSNPSSDTVPNHMARAAYFAHAQEQGLSDPVQLMRMLAERAQKQQKSSNQSPVETPQATPSVPSTRRDDSSNASAAAARAWMSIGAGGFKQATENSGVPKAQISPDPSYNPSREFRPQISQVRGEFPLSGGMQTQSERKSFPLQPFVPQPVRVGNEAQLQNRPIVFPQLAPADLSRFQVQYPWRGLSPHTQPRPKQETLPPDLNIGFQSPGSPVRPSSGVLVDSPQPDLALQL